MDNAIAGDKNGDAVPENGAIAVATEKKRFMGAHLTMQRQQLP